MHLFDLFFVSFRDEDNVHAACMVLYTGTRTNHHGEPSTHRYSKTDKILHERLSAVDRSLLNRTVAIRRLFV